MDRQQMLEALAQMGVDTSSITDAVPDPVLAEWLRGYEALEQPAEGATDHADGDKPGEPEEKYPPQDDSQHDDMADPPSRDEMIAALEGAGHSRADLDSLSDEELANLYDQSNGESQMADYPTTGNGEDTHAHPVQFPADTYADEDEDDKDKKKMADRRYSEQIGAAIAPVLAKLVRDAEVRINRGLAPTIKKTGDLARNQKRANVIAFCEAQRALGKLMPAEFETVVKRMLRADDRRVRAFSEQGGKKQSQTELDLQMKEIEDRDVILTFAERLKQPVGVTDNEVQKVKANFQAFSEKYGRTGTTEDKMVKAFKFLRGQNPQMTAEDFCSIKG